MTISFDDWKKQLSSDKILYEQAKEMAKHGHQQQTGYKKAGNRFMLLSIMENFIVSLLLDTGERNIGTS